MCSCHSIPECCVMFSGVKLSMGSFVLFMNDIHEIFLKKFSVLSLFIEELLKKYWCLTNKRCNN